MQIDYRLQAVKEIKETQDYRLVNQLVKSGWILICIFNREEGLVFSLGRIMN